MIEPLPYLSQARLSRPALRALRPTAIAITPPAPRSARWFTTGQTGDPLTEHLRRLPYPRAGRETDVVVLPRRWPTEGTARLLRAYHHGDPRRPLTVVHHGAGGGSLLRALAAADGRTVTTIAVPQPTPAAHSTVCAAISSLVA